MLRRSEGIWEYHLYHFIHFASPCSHSPCSLPYVAKKTSTISIMLHAVDTSIFRSFIDWYINDLYGCPSFVILCGWWQLFWTYNWNKNVEPQHEYCKNRLTVINEFWKIYWWSFSSSLMTNERIKHKREFESYKCHTKIAKSKIHVKSRCNRTHLWQCPKISCPFHHWLFLWC